MPPNPLILVTFPIDGDVAFVGLHVGLSLSLSDGLFISLFVGVVVGVSVTLLDFRTASCILAFHIHFDEGEKTSGTSANVPRFGLEIHSVSSAIIDKQNCFKRFCAIYVSSLSIPYFLIDF